MAQHALRYFLFGFVLWLTVGTPENSWAQDPFYSQFYSAPILVNPAFTGTADAPRIALNSRLQWPGLIDGVTYQTTSGVYEQFFEPMNSGIGLSVMSDNLGDGAFRTTRFYANYAYRVSVNDDFHLKLGLEAGGQHIALDWDRFTFYDQIDPVYGFVDANGNPNFTGETRPDIENKTVFDFGAGLLAYTPDWYAGVSVHHLNTPDMAFLNNNPNINTGLPLRFSAIVGTEIELIEGNRTRRAAFISPNLLFVRQGDQGQINGGAYLSYGSIFGGMWYRHAWGNPDAVIGMLGYQFDVFKLGYSYDFTVSDLDLGNTGGAHEVSIVINFAESASYKRTKRNNRYNDCFGLFR